MGINLRDVETELARVEQRLHTLQQASRTSLGQSNMGAQQVRDMNARLKQLQDAPKNAFGRTTRAAAAEIESLKQEMKTRSAAVDATLKELQSQSAEARDLAKRQQELSTLRAQIISRGG
ncbi:MAG TPA: hypothetical protein VFW71_09210 [Actinomycetota bacterium]|nr:hypothetical protein [Actinomycetota bacterium]